MEYSQVVRHPIFILACKGLNPFTPDYENPIGSVMKLHGKRLTAVHEPSLEGKDRRRKAIPSNQPTCRVELNTTLISVRFFYQSPGLCLIPCSVNLLLVDLIEKNAWFPDASRDRCSQSPSL
ncbi:hypothetical protein GQ457_02G005690 [Hibiscus cannabinus]